MVAACLLEWATACEWERPVFLATAVPIFFTLLAMLRKLDLTMERLKLGDELRAYPSGRFRPADLVAIRFAPDADEDHAEDKLPVPWCQVAVESRRERTIRLVVSAGDAARLREWA